MNILILNTQIPYCSGGAEILARDLDDSLKRAGHSSEILTLPFKWYPQESLVNSILASKLFDISSYNGMNVDRVIALKFPAWLIPHPQKSFWILHQHRTAYDLWATEFSELAVMPDGAAVRDLIHREDYAAISASDSVYSISQTVSDRLERYSGLGSDVLYPPPRNMEKFHCDSYGDYFYFPSRITPLKRQELIVDAMEYVTEPVKVVFAGEADDPEYLRKLKQRAEKMNSQGEVEWLGRVPDQEHLQLYAQSLMVLFTPQDEDYGYVTPEAMLSSKGVISCSDSGGATEFVTHDETGFITQADPRVIAETMSRVWRERELATRMGQNARDAVSQIDFSWSNILDRLL